MSKQYKVVNGTSYDSRTPDTVVNILENVRHSKQRIRLHYGNVQTGQDWHDEHDVRGTIGRSTGSVKIPLLIANSRSMGGPSVLDHCIVGIRTTGKNGKWLYRHPTYKAKRFHITESDKSEDYPFLVFALDGEANTLVARFKTSKQAERYTANVTGQF